MSQARVNEIDLLRFVAAMSVVLFHYSFRGFAADGLSVMPYPSLAPVAKYGYLGVELFFMVSGFVILMTAASGVLRRFVISRLVRLYPAFWVCCTLTFALIITIGNPRFTASIGQYMVNMTMLSGAVNVPPIDPVYWSLFVELRFYALVAFVLACGRISQAEPLLWAWLACAIGLETVSIPLFRYLLIVEYAAYFIAGAMCFIVWSKGVSYSRGTAVALCWGLAVYQSIRALPALEIQYHANLSRIATVGIISMFFGAMFLVALRATGPLARMRWLMAGAVTYPLYLLHQYIGYMIFNRAYPAISSHVLLWSVVALMLIVSYTVHVLVEARVGLPMKRLLNGLYDVFEHALATVGARIGRTSQLSRDRNEPN
jgi:peptidoglycan/LPS O-acetylase OafA/YrhL